MADLFAEKAKDWDASDRRTRLASAIGSSIRDNVEIREDMTVLDFGAGTGLLTAQIAPRVKRVAAVDMSQAMLEKLCAKPELEERVDIYCQDLMTDPLATQFDLIVSAMTLHHVEDTAGLLQSFHRHLKDGGSVALADLDSEDGSFHAPGTEGIFHHGFDRDELRAILQAEGFDRVEFHTAHTIVGETKDYPIFLVTATKA
jgi:putative AdoMet-dependent methyltransferase